MKREPIFFMNRNTNLILEVIDNPESHELSRECPAYEKLTANTSEGAAEKHLPVIERDGNHVIVKIGSVLHPMTDDHSITWVYLQTKSGGQRIYLNATDEPVANFMLQAGDDPVAAYAYCNLHGFWKTEIH